MTRSIPALVLCLLPALACGPKEPPPAPPEPEPAPAPPPPDPIPADFGALTPQLVVPDVQTAIDFYASAFGAQTVYTLPGGPNGGLMHAQIKIGDSVLMIDPASEQMKDPMALGGSPVTLMLYVDDADASFEQATGAGAVVNMPLEDTFWGDRYGQLIDPFGHAWAVATHIEDLTDEQMQQRAALLPKPKKGKKKKKKKGKPKWAEIAGTPAEKKVPDGYHTVTMSLTVDDANAAIAFYTAAFGATERSRMPGPDGRLMHAEVDIGGDILMLADENPEMGVVSAKTLGGSPVTIHHYVADVDATFGTATSSGGTEVVALGDMPWGDRWGVLLDPAGLPWGLASHKEDVTPEQIQERMAAGAGGDAAGGEAPAEGGEAAPAEGDEAAAEPAA